MFKIEQSNFLRSIYKASVSIVMKLRSNNLRIEKCNQNPSSISRRELPTFFLDFVRMWTLQKIRVHSAIVIIENFLLFLKLFTSHSATRVEFCHRCDVMCHTSPYQCYSETTLSNLIRSNHLIIRGSSRLLNH